MKPGETIPVTIAGQVVTQATIKEIGDGTATLVVPATLVVMATRTELSYEPQEGPQGVETIIDGVTRPDNNAEPVEAPVAPVGDVQPAVPVDVPVEPVDNVTLVTDGEQD